MLNRAVRNVASGLKRANTTRFITGVIYFGRQMSYNKRTTMLNDAFTLPFPLSVFSCTFSFLLLHLILDARMLCRGGHIFLPANTIILKVQEQSVLLVPLNYPF